MLLLIIVLALILAFIWAATNKSANNYVSIGVYISCTFRSWVDVIFSHSRTVSLLLGHNYALKCSSDNFPQTNYTSPCMENCQTYIAMYFWSPIAGRRSWKVKKKLWDKSVPQFSQFFKPSPWDWRKIKILNCGYENFPFSWSRNWSLSMKLNVQSIHNFLEL